MHFDRALPMDGEACAGIRARSRNEHHEEDEESEQHCEHLQNKPSASTGGVIAVEQLLVSPIHVVQRRVHGCVDAQGYLLLHADDVHEALVHLSQLHDRALDVLDGLRARGQVLVGLVERGGLLLLLRLHGRTGGAVGSEAQLVVATTGLVVVVHPGRLVRGGSGLGHEGVEWIRTALAHGGVAHGARAAVGRMVGRIVAATTATKATAM